MSSMNSISLFKEYMENEKISPDKVEYNIKVVTLLYNNVLLPLNKELNDIDIYAIDEFTDRVDIIDKFLEGRNGIEMLLEALLLLTEFLKTNKLIKGGKIAYYRRIFINKDYYLDKYDSIKGKRDNVKEFIKRISKNRISYLFTRLVEDINVNPFTTVIEVEASIDEESSMEVPPTLLKVLQNINLIEKKGKKIIASKNGRALLRLESEERYSAILYSLIYKVNWKDIYSNNLVNINEIIAIVCSLFNKNDYLYSESNCYCPVDNVLESSKDNIRFNKFLRVDETNEIFQMLFVNMGIVSKSIHADKDIYSLTKLGKNIMKILYNENECYIKAKLDKINSLIKNKELDRLEVEILSYINVFGGSTIMWDYLGQIYILKKSYKKAYDILLYAYETSSKQGKDARKSLSHLIICCRKLQFNMEEEKYEKKYKLIQR